MVEKSRVIFGPALHISSYVISGLYCISIMVDALDGAVGAVLHQKEDDDWQPLSFFSRKLSQAEARYGTFGREPLAIFLAMKRFASLRGRSKLLCFD